MATKRLTIDALKAEASEFCKSGAKSWRKELFGINDGKAIGTYVEREFQSHLGNRYRFDKGNSASGIDFPSLNIDLKVTSIKQPQSSCPFRSAHQKVYGLGYGVPHLANRSQNRHYWPCNRSPAGGPHMRISRSRFASLLPAAPALCLSALPAVAAVEPKTAGEILDYIDDLFRGESSQAKLSMHVKTGHWERSLELEAWSKGKERSFIRILAAIALLDARSAQIQPSVTWSASHNVEVVGGAVVGIGEHPAVAKRNCGARPGYDW